MLKGWAQSISVFGFVIFTGLVLRSFNEFDISFSRSLNFGEDWIALTGVFSAISSGSEGNRE